MFFKTYWILGQNARNLNYIKPHNNSFARYIADSKLRTKEFLSSKWVPVSETFFVIKTHKELDNIDLSILIPPFVIKPNFWFGWKWILIFDKIDSIWNFITNDWISYSKKALQRHLSEILDWFYSLSWSRDTVIVEKKLELDTSIELLWKYGLPDIRLVVYNMTPVMAMLRIPTKESGWKANLHSWACWAWIDIGSWKITYLSHHDKIIKSVPWIWDIRWISLPKWEEVLTMWVKLQKYTWIWYLACDIILDKEKWPLLLEVNIRPGLNLQIANKAPLLKRLKKLDGITVDSIEKWVRLWKDLFWGDLEWKVQDITWKKILGSKEFVTINHLEKTYKYLSSIQISQNPSFIDKSFLIDILKIPKEEITNTIYFESIILWEKKEIKFSVKELDWVNIILWKNALKWFYIDPYKYKKWDSPEYFDFESNSKNNIIKKNYQIRLSKIDKELMDIDKRLNILKKIVPINLFEEKVKFKTLKWEYIPQFKYAPLDFDLNELRETVEKIDISDIPMSSIFKRKKDEILIKIKFFEAFSEWNAKWVYKYSKELFWDVIPDNLTYAKDVVLDSHEIEPEKEFVSFVEIKSMINKFNHIYGINLTLWEYDMSSRFAVSWNKVKIRTWAKVWKKELRSIIAHEIEWHYLKRYNWRQYDYKILSSWTAWYIEDEEWVAIYNQSRFLTKRDPKYFGIYKSYIRLQKAKTMPYNEFLDFIVSEFKWDYEKVFNSILRLKRWMPSFDSEWVFMKDVVYLNWFLRVSDFIENGWNLKDLYIWKIWIMDLADLKNPDFPLKAKKDLIYPLFL